ncbi:hypothetical protein Moror_16884 [Moniliophthora roreri MCA 2997]|uniref:DUF7330 domain-containing protein n=2 Tax=Moniliophthora roreri TaxID=221103 RepID=V2WSC6_MONRO|nr:hypothetical protein Moror_16884 [Moniliophthora roreri MCA 2997]KAI3620879.1 hypothetical protein WG66_006269 [Moniliophthora roreri]
MQTITKLKDRVKSWRRGSVSQTSVTRASNKASTKTNHVRLHRETGDIKEEFCIDPSREDIRLLAEGHEDSEGDRPKNLDIKAKDGNVELSVDLFLYSSFATPPIVMDVQSEKGSVSMELDAPNTLMSAALTLNIHALKEVKLKVPNHRAGLLKVSAGEVVVKGSLEKNISIISEYEGKRKYLIGDWCEGQRLDVYNIQVQEGNVNIQFIDEHGHAGGGVLIVV